MKVQEGVFKHKESVELSYIQDVKYPEKFLAAVFQSG